MELVQQQGSQQGALVEQAPAGCTSLLQLGELQVLARHPLLPIDERRRSFCMIAVRPCISPSARLFPPRLAIALCSKQLCNNCAIVTPRVIPNLNRALR